MSFIVPAVLPASRKDFDEKLALLTGILSVSRIQIDVVDGLFARPASWPYTAPSELKQRMSGKAMLPHLDRVEYEIDLMCHHALEAADAWLALGATRLTFHAESATDLRQLLASAQMRYGNIIAYGVALNIGSDLALIEPLLGTIDYVQYMGISHIGRQAEPFDPRVVAKVRLFRSRHPGLRVQVDGGITRKSANELANLGVSNLIVGSDILRAKDPAAEVAKLEALQTPFGI